MSLREVFNVELPDEDEYLNADTCTLHALCSCCRNLFQGSSHIRHIVSPLETFPPSVERFTLWHSLEDLRRSVRGRCHFCTMVWQIISRDKAGHPRTDEELLNIATSEVVLEISSPYSPRINDNAQIEEKLKFHIRVGCGDREMPGYGKIEVLNYEGRGMPPTSTTHPAQSYFLTSSDEHAKLASYWFRECLAKHEFCCSSDPAFTPTRLVQIQESDNGLVKIIESAGSNDEILYCTLSHSWGGATDIVTLNSKNLDELSTAFSIQRLPRTFRDAVEITLRLGHRHLWIDCLCIIQDSEEDWAWEASRMSSVYENASCTIAAMIGTTPHHGCFTRRDPLTHSPCRIATYGSKTLFAHAGSPTGDEYTVERGHLNTRAWVLQERIFSPRILCFTQAGIFWSCRAGRAAERDQDGWGRPRGGARQIFGSAVTSVDEVLYYDDIRTGMFERLLYHCPPTDVRTCQLFSYFWFSVVCEYSRRNMTVSTDKLMAISSIANRVQEKAGFKYVAGLWSETLGTDLLWQDSEGTTRDRPNAYRAPSWSWASVDGIIEWQGGDAIQNEFLDPQQFEFMFNIVDLDLQLHPGNRSGTGLVKCGTLVLEGALKKPFQITDCAKRDIDLEFEGQLDIALNEPADDEPSFIHTLHPDFNLTPAQINDVHLLPLRRATIQVPDFIPRRNPYKQRIQGIAVVKSGDCSVYERVGLFNIRCREPPFLATNWFSDAIKQRIEIQ